MRSRENVFGVQLSGKYLFFKNFKETVHLLLKREATVRNSGINRIESATVHSILRSD